MELWLWFVSAAVKYYNQMVVGLSVALHCTNHTKTLNVKIAEAADWLQSNVWMCLNLASFLWYF